MFGGCRSWMYGLHWRISRLRAWLPRGNRWCRQSRWGTAWTRTTGTSSPLPRPPPTTSTGSEASPCWGQGPWWSSPPRGWAAPTSTPSWRSLDTNYTCFDLITLLQIYNSNSNVILLKVASYCGVLISVKLGTYKIATPTIDMNNISG